MAEVVGTAFVRIRALTSGLAKDIEKNVSKAAREADVDSSGELIGDNLVKGAGRKLKDKFGDVVSDATKNIDKKVDVDGGRRVGDRLAEGIRSGISGALNSRAFSSISNRIARLLGIDEKSGNRSGRRFGRGILGAIAKFGVLFSPAILGLGSLLLQYVVALTAQIGLLASAAAGAGVALGTVLGATALGIIPIILAFKANTRQLERFKEVAEGVGDAWIKVGAAAQETLLPGLTSALKLSKQAIPIFKGYAREIGRVAGAFAEMTVREIVEDQERLRNILQGSSRIFNSLAGAAFNFITIFFDLFEAAIPIGEQFAASVEKISDRWQNLIGEASNSGRLTAVFQEWYDKASLVGVALRDLVVGIANIFSVGSDSAVPFFQNFATWAAEFRAFTESATGQNKLKQIFNDALEVAHEFNGLIVDIGRRIGAGVFEEGGNEGIISFIRVLREDVVPFLDTTFRQIIEDMGPALRGLAEAFGDFLSVFAESGGLRLAIELLAGVFSVLTAILRIPGMDKFLATMLALTAVFKIIKLTGIVTVFNGLRSAIVVLAPLMPVLGTGIVSIISPFLLAAAAIAAVVAGIVLLIVHWDKVKAAFNATVRFLKDPMERLTALKENIENLVGTIREKLGQALGAAGRALSRFGGVIKEKVEDAIGNVVEFLSRIPGMIGRALLKLGSALIQTFAKAFVAVISALPGLIGDILYFFVALPFRITFALANLGLELVNIFLSAVAGLGIWLATEGIPAVVGFFVDLPGNIISTLDTLGDTLREIFSKALDIVITFIAEKGPGVLQWFLELPGKIGGFLSELPGRVIGAFSSAFDSVTTAISDFVTVTLPGFGEDMLTAGSSLIGKLVEGLGKAISGTTKIAKDIVNGIIRFINREVITKINDLLEFDIGGRFGTPKIHIDGPDLPQIPQLKANGDIFRRATNIIAGEDGTEVLIPLTRPRRALELFEQSGLANVLARARSGSTSGAPRNAPTRGGIVFEEGAIQVTAQGVSATAVIDEMNAKLGWQLTTRGDR